LGGDEFLLLCPGVDRASVGKLVKRLSRKLRLIPLASEGEIVPTASIGIALFPEDGLDGVALVKKAGLAMFVAKSSGRDRHQFFSPAMETTAHARLIVERELRRAILRDEIGVGYQPQIDLETGALTGIEALARWNHNGLGQVSPKEFIWVAEDSGLIGPLGEYILRKACRQHAEWVRTGLCTVPIAVNVSALQFREANFLETVECVLEDSGLPAAFLEIELTESVVMHPADASLEKLKALRERGLRPTIDDFGTGYSSLSYLRQFPVSRIKVDRSFVRDLTTNKDSAAITAAIIVLGHSMGFQVVAEGVEHERQAEFPRGLGCDQAQGNLYSVALSASAFGKSLLRAPGQPTLVRQGFQSCD
jgi:predicted signal transduction protein with EAL and GGDEF domain